MAQTKRASNTQIAEPLPHNLEAERSVLGAILLDNAAFAEAEKQLTPSSWFLPQHRHIWGAMQRLAKKQIPIETVFLAEELEVDQGGLAAAGGVGYISQLPDGLPKAVNVAHYARIVEEKAIQREVMYTASGLLASAGGSNDLATLERQISSLHTNFTARAHGQTNGNGNGYHRYSTLDFLGAEFEAPEHLVEGIFPRGGSGLIVAMPHHLKSWFTLGLAYGSTRAGLAMGKLEVKKPVRTLLFPIEDFPGQVQWRMRQLLSTLAYRDVDPGMVDVIPRPKSGFDIMDEHCFQYILGQIKDFRADHAIFDVLRRMFRGDINSPKDSAALCEQLDRLRDETGVATTVVHHENRKEADLMRASAGSFNIPAWANVVIQFKRKFQEGSISHVEIEVDNKLAQSPDPVRMILNLEADNPLKLEPLEDIAGVQELREKLGVDWTVNDMKEVLSVDKSNAYRRLKKMLIAQLVEKVSTGRRGRVGGLARYCFTQDSSTAE